MNINELFELNARLSTKVLDLVDKLAESEESANYLYNKCEKYEAEKKLKENEMETQP